jgi:glycosyltransferase involved in cell wall biosynthesis
MTEINILHLDTEREWRGGQQQAIYLFEYLLKHGYKTMFVCRRNSKLGSYLQKQNLPTLFAPLVGEWDLFSAFKIATCAKQNNYNLLHLHSAHAITIGLLVKIIFPKIKLIAVRRVDFSIHKNILSKYKYKNRLLNGIVAISENIKNILAKDGLETTKITVIRSGIDLDKFNQSPKDGKLRQMLNIRPNAILVGTIAALVGHKDYPTLLKAAEIVNAADENVYFIAVGDGNKKVKIQNLAETLNLKGRFIFLGYRTDIGNVLKALDIFVLASKLEGLGTAVLEAMSVGLPIIGTNAGGIPEMVNDGKNGLLVQKENPEALAKAILDLCENRGKRKAFSQASLQMVKAYSKDITARKNIELYEKIL